MDNETVRKLAGTAGLQLDDERLGLIAPQLGAWLSGANELNRKLDAETFRGVGPITVFRHPAYEGREE